MSLVMEILENLWNTTAYYKGMRVNIFGIPKPWKYKESSVGNTLSRLHKKGFVENTSGKWSITKKGREYFKKRKKFLAQFNSPFRKDSPKNLLLMFDVPESRRGERKWLRKHLRKFQYFMVQKSVWVGPSPLPKEFVSYLKEIKLQSFIKTFKLSKPYKINRK